MGAEIESPPVLKTAGERRESIVANSPGSIEISENPGAIGAQPFYELESMSEVNQWCGLIIQISKMHGVSPALTAAIMHTETTHGYYDAVWPWRKTILPMNIHYTYWRDLGVTPALLGCPYYNVEFGVILLARISARVQDPTPRKVATLYNNLAADRVSEYGARVAQLMQEKPWTPWCRP